MQLIRQQHRLGCGIAVLAMLTAQTYEQVYEDFGRPDLTGDKGGLTDSQIHDYLKPRGMRLGKRYTEPYRVLCLCLVHVYPWSLCNHWVILREDGWVLDPLSPYPWRLSDYDAVNSVVGIVYRQE